MSLQFKSDSAFFAKDERIRMALLLTSLELKHRFEGVAGVWAEDKGEAIHLSVALKEDRFIWETQYERMRYWAHSSVLQSRLAEARYGLPIQIKFWAGGMWEPLGAFRVDEAVPIPTHPPEMPLSKTVEHPVPSEPRAKPAQTDAHVATGCALFVLGKIEFAKQAFRKALVIDENHTEAWFHLGNMYYVEQDFAKAVIYFRAAINCNSEHCLAWQSLGNALCSMQSYAPGMVCYNKALQLDAKSPGLHHNMGNALIGMKKYVEAELRLREALLLDPSQEKTYNTLGNLYFSRQDYPAAAAHYEVCVMMRPSYAPAHTNLGNALLSMHDGPRAIRCYEEGLKLDPSSAGVRYNLALAYLREGRFEQGWQAHEARWEFKELRIPRRKFKAPMWDGKQFNSKTLLVYAEQGLGDTLQFCRYLDYVHALAGNSGKIIFEVQERLVRLMQHNYAGECIEVVKRGAPLKHFDARVPLMSLPMLFGTRLTNIPVPSRYIASIGSSGWASNNLPLRVGLSWAGNPKYKADNLRSIPVEHFKTLPVTNVTYVNLQREKDEDVARLETWLPLEVPPDPVDMADTAAVIESLDIVITSDTAVAHLAGAMGKPVWLMICYLADWRWLNRDWTNSPWYPSLRIFRQKIEGDWSKVLLEVGHTIENLGAMYDRFS
jgi:tetratricopeptide (TPR) repeat protein